MTDNIDDVLENDPFDDEQLAEQSTRLDTDGESENDAEDELEANADSTAMIPEASVPNSTAEPPDGEVGHVLASEEIRVTRSEYNVNVFVTTDRRDDVRVGDYVEIPYPEGRDDLFSVIDGLRYEPYTELDDKSDTHNHISKHRELDESEFVLVAELDPIAILRQQEGADGLERGIVNRIPKPNTPVRLSRDDAHLRTGLNIPQEGIFAGHLSVGGDAMEIDGDPFPYYIQNPGIDPDTGEVESGEPAIFRHALVAGSTGTGKTHFTKNLLRQFVTDKRYPVDTGPDGELERSRLNVIIFDPENEYWEMREDNPELTDEQRRYLRRQGIEYDGIDDLEVFVPEIDNTRVPSTGESQSLTIPFSLVEREPRLVMPFDQTSDVTRGAIENCIDTYFDCFDDGTDWPERDVNDPKYEDFVAFLREHEDDRSRLREHHDIGNGTWSAVCRRVIQSEYFDVFDGGINPFPEITDQLFREGQVTVIPTSHVRGEKEYLVILSILSYIIENKIDDFDVDETVKRTPMLVAVDEAHNYFSNPDNIREAYIVGRAREAVKQGRKDKLGLMMITQNPEDIDGDILKQTNTNVFLHLREEVVEDVASVPRGYKRDVPKFGKGQAVVKAPDVEAVEVVGLPYCLTRHDN